MAKRPKVTLRPAWTPDFKNDPMYPFYGVPPPSLTVVAPPDTTPLLKRARKVSWGSVKAQYSSRRPDSGADNGE